MYHVTPRPNEAVRLRVEPSIYINLPPAKFAETIKEAAHELRSQLISLWEKNSPKFESRWSNWTKEVQSNFLQLARTSQSVDFGIFDNKEVFFNYICPELQVFLLKIMYSFIPDSQSVGNWFDHFGASNCDE